MDWHVNRARCIPGSDDGSKEVIAESADDLGKCVGGERSNNEDMCPSPQLDV